jgi:molybdopterin molybdotransferase
VFVERRRARWTITAVGGADAERLTREREVRPPPLWFGSAPGGQVVFGLPGNPVAALACLVRFVLPALDLAAGAIPNPPERIALADAIEGRRMTTFLPVKVSTAGGIASIAIPRPPNGSGDFLALAGTTGFVELPPRPEGYPAGFTAELYRW